MGQPRHPVMSKERPTHLATSDPLASCQIHLLNLILLDGQATVVLWLLPLQGAASVVNVGHIKRALALGRFACGNQSNKMTITNS